MKHLLAAATLIAGLTAATRHPSPVTPHPTIPGPPWISIEHPVNPYDATTRGAFLVVHAFHHGTPTDFPVRGTAEGIRDGKRHTVSLEFTSTSRAGVYALKKQWSDAGTWTLVIAVSQAKDDQVQAIIDLGANGLVASVRVPTKRDGEWLIPAPVPLADIEKELRARSGS